MEEEDEAHEGEECAICYSAREDGEEDGAAVDVFCAHCERPFHNACLAGWLKSLRTSRITFGMLFGACPVCSGEVSLKESE